MIYNVRFFEQDLVSQETGKVVRPAVLHIEEVCGIEHAQGSCRRATEEDQARFPDEYAKFLASKGNK